MDFESLFIEFSDAMEVKPQSGHGPLDVFLVTLDLSVGGTTTPTPNIDPGGPCPARDSFIQLNRAYTGSELGALFAHELMHAFQLKLADPAGCSANRWFKEASALWAEVHALEGVIEPDSRRSALLSGYIGSHDKEMAMWGPATGHGSSAYPFLVFLDRKFGPEAVLTAVKWLATLGTPYDALDTGIPGNVSEAFQDFGVFSWGEPPYEALREDLLPRVH